MCCYLDIFHWHWGKISVEINPPAWEPDDMNPLRYPKTIITASSPCSFSAKHAAVSEELNRYWKILFLRWLWKLLRDQTWITDTSPCAWVNDLRSHGGQQALGKCQFLLKSIKEHILTAVKTPTDPRVLNLSSMHGWRSPDGRRHPKFHFCINRVACFNEHTQQSEQSWLPFRLHSHGVTPCSN